MYTSPVLVTATECLFAAAIVTTKLDRSAATFFGTATDLAAAVSRPCPNCPYRFDPIEKSSPSAVVSSVWCLANATSLTTLPPAARLATSLGWMTAEA